MADPAQEDQVAKWWSSSQVLGKLTGRGPAGGAGAVGGLLVARRRLRCGSGGRFLKAAGAGFVASLLPRRAEALERAELVFASSIQKTGRRLCGGAGERDRDADCERRPAGAWA